MTLFSSLSQIREEIQAALAQQNLTDMTPIQSASLPASLSGKDILAQGKTGSGKTVAFAVSCLNLVEIKQFSPQVLVLCPTRELAAQVAEQFRFVGRAMANLKVLTLCGGEPMGPQIQSLKHGAHVVVGTPGRILDHGQKRRLDLSNIKIRVLDEADRMLDMGFAEDVESIFELIPLPVQTLLFSATWTDPLKQLASHFLVEPVTVSPDVTETLNTDIQQIAYKVEDHTRLNTLKAVLTTWQPAKCIVFCNTRRMVLEAVNELADSGFSVAGLQGDMEQAQRSEVLARFAAEAVNVLVATDVAARGLDIKDVDCVINAEVSEETDNHIHRIGRTGRAGAKGIAVTLFSDQEQLFFERIAEKFDNQVPVKGGQSLRFHANRIPAPQFECIAVNGGKKQKLRPGDFLGSLTKDADVPGDDIGKIAVQNNHSYVAVKQRSVKRALKLFREGRIKGKRVRARKLS